MLGCSIIRAHCGQDTCSQRRGGEHNGDDPRGGRVSGNGVREAYTGSPAQRYRVQRAKDRDRKRGEFLTRERDGR
jgi:hypothetical protein